MNIQFICRVLPIANRYVNIHSVDLTTRVENRVWSSLILPFVDFFNVYFLKKIMLSVLPANITTYGNLMVLLKDT